MDFKLTDEDLIEYSTSLIEIARDSDNCQEIIQKCLANFNSNINTIIKTRVKIVNNLFELAKNSRNRRFSKLEVHEKLAILQAVDSDLDALTKSQRPVPRSRREADDKKTLMEILNDFRNTKESIQSEDDWKLYNLTEWDTTKEFFDLHNTTIMTPTTTNTTVNPCQCNYGTAILYTLSAVGVMIILIAGITKLIKKYRK